MRTGDGLTGLEGIWRAVTRGLRCAPHPGLSHDGLSALPTEGRIIYLETPDVVTYGIRGRWRGGSGGVLTGWTGMDRMDRDGLGGLGGRGGRGGRGGDG